jgi:serine/threonine protein kinase
MAPEQATGQDMTPAVDVFSWGATVTFAATGHSPFGEGQPDAVVYRLVHDEPNLLGIDPRLLPILRATLSKNPSLRPTPEQLLVSVVQKGMPAVARTRADDLTTAVLDRTWIRSSALVSPESATSNRTARDDLGADHRRPSVTSHRWVWLTGLLVLILLIGVGAFALGHVTSSSRHTSRQPSEEAQSTTTTTSSLSNGTTTSTTAVSEPATFNYSTAVSEISSLGYTVEGQQNEDGYPGPLAVLIGVCTPSADGYCQHAFFFVNNRYIGTDTGHDDITVSVSWQNSNTVALSYPIYNTSDPMCCPTGGSRLVRFYWNGSALKPLDPLPSDPNAP